MRLATNQQTFSIANTALFVLPSNPRRYALRVQSPSAGVLTVRFGDVATTTYGYQIQPAATGTRFCVDEDGEDIQKPVSMIMSVAGPTTIGVIESIVLP
jgi:hypothetical protein